LKDYSKILFLSSEFPPGPGGIGNHAWNLCKELNNHIPVHVLTVSDYAEENQCSKFDNEEIMYIYRFKKYKLSLLTYIKRIYDIIRHIKKYHYSHCLLSGRFSLYTSSIICYCFGRNKLIGILHGSELCPATKLSKLLLIRSLKNLHTIVSVSKYTESLIPANSTNKSIRYVIPNGVNTKLVSKTKIKNSIIIHGYPCLLTVGSITNRKGQINLVKSLPLIIEQYPKAHYHCVGLPLEGEEISKTAKQLGVEKHLTLHGYLPNDQLSDIYKQSDIFILLSQSNVLYDVEGFGIVILEANLCGISAIGSKNTGIEDAIVHQKTGLLIDPYNKHEILQAIDQMLSKKDMFSRNAVEWAQTHHWGNIVNKYLQIIENE